MYTILYIRTWLPYTQHRTEIYAVHPQAYPFAVVAADSLSTPLAATSSSYTLYTLYNTLCYNFATTVPFTGKEHVENGIQLLKRNGM